MIKNIVCHIKNGCTKLVGRINIILNKIDKPINTKSYYKIVRDNQTTFGSQHITFPSSNKPGGWVSVNHYHEWNTSAGFSRIFNNDLYITTDPRCHLHSSNVKIYLVEAEDVVGEENVFGTFTCKRFRLITQVQNKDLENLNIYAEGEHVITNGFVLGMKSACLYCLSNNSSNVQEIKDLRTSVITKLLDSAKMQVVPRMETRKMKYTPKQFVLSFLKLPVAQRLELAVKIGVDYNQSSMSEPQLMTFILNEIKKMNKVDEAWNLIQESNKEAE